MKNEQFPIVRQGKLHCRIDFIPPLPIPNALIKLKLFNKLQKFNSCKVLGSAEYGGSTDSSASEKFALVSANEILFHESSFSAAIYITLEWKLTFSYYNCQGKGNCCLWDRTVCAVRIATCNFNE